MRKRTPLTEAAKSTAPEDDATGITVPSTLPVLEPTSKIEALKLARKTVAARLMGTGAGRERVIEALVRHDASLSQYAARRLYYEILGEWKQDYETEAPYHRAAQVRRLMEELATMRSERITQQLPPGRERPTWNDIARHERLLAQITGTMAPINVRVLDVHETMRESLTAVIGDMTPDEMKEILTEGFEVEQEAAE